LVSDGSIDDLPHPPTPHAPPITGNYKLSRGETAGIIAGEPQMAEVELERKRGPGPAAAAFSTAVAAVTGFAAATISAAVQSLTLGLSWLNLSIFEVLDGDALHGFSFWGDRDPWNKG